MKTPACSESFLASFHVCLRISAATILLATFSSCASPLQKGSKDLASTLAIYGWKPYSPPQGDPNNSQSWLKLGPGAVISKKSDQQTWADSDVLLGSNSTTIVMNANNQRPAFLPKGSTYSSGSVNIEASADLAKIQETATAALAANGSYVTSTDVEFINPKIVQPYSLGTFMQILDANWKHLDPYSRKKLRRDQAYVVSGVMVADGLILKFYTYKKGDAKISGALTPAQTAALAASGLSVSNGGIEISKPFFLAWRPSEPNDALLAEQKERSR